MSYFFAIALLAFEVYLAVHAYNSGRSFWWMFFILFVPIAGVLVYIFAAWVPDFERSLEGRSYGAARQDTFSRTNGRPRLTMPSGRSDAVDREAENAAQKLKMLKEMLDDDLITIEDYEIKKAQILAEM